MRLKMNKLFERDLNIAERNTREAKEFSKDIRKYFYELEKERPLTDKEKELSEKARNIHVYTNDTLCLISELKVNKHLVDKEIEKIEDMKEKDSEYESTAKNKNAGMAQNANEPLTNELNIITIADLHGTMSEEAIICELDNVIRDADITLLLGDIMYPELNCIVDYFKSLRYQIPLYGVLGNHDPKNLFDDFSEINSMNVNPHTKTRKGTFYSICALSGALKYKDSDYYALLSQEESVKITDNLPECDIFICHDKPKFEKPSKWEEIAPNAHEGLWGIGKYILEKQPRHVFHGHLHKRYTHKESNTIIHCCYGIEKHLITI